MNYKGMALYSIIMSIILVPTAFYLVNKDDLGIVKTLLVLIFISQISIRIANLTESKKGRVNK
jgi:uncharacterized membrane protein